MENMYTLFVLLGFAASIVSAIFGFGTALIVLAIGAYLLPIKEVIVLATVLFLASNITKTALFSKHIDWRITTIMALASFPFAYLGGSLLVDLPSDLLKRLLGIMVLIYLILTTLREFPTIKIGTPTLITGSAIYGFLSGLLGSGNLIKVIIFQQLDVRKQAFVGAMAATTILTNTAKLTAYYQSKLLSNEFFWPIIGLIISAITAALIGKHILNKLSSTQFELGIKIILAVSASGLIL